VALIEPTFMPQSYKQARDRPDLIVFAIHPGWVKTGKRGSNMTVSASTLILNAALVDMSDDVPAETLEVAAKIMDGEYHLQ
jgi:hypothetical protein